MLLSAAFIIDLDEEKRLLPIGKKPNELKVKPVPLKSSLDWYGHSFDYIFHYWKVACYCFIFCVVKPYPNTLTFNVTTRQIYNERP